MPESEVPEPKEKEKEEKSRVPPPPPQSRVPSRNPVVKKRPVVK